MWCFYFQLERDCQGICSLCPYGYNPFNNCPQFNYECPDCHAKFNSPAIPAITSALTYRCPFCGRIMVGLS